MTKYPWLLKQERLMSDEIKVFPMVLMFVNIYLVQRPMYNSENNMLKCYLNSYDLIKD